MGARDEGRINSGGGEPLVAVGLTVGGLLSMKIPGSYAGSIGFSSNDSLYHVGNKLVSESEKGEWGMLTGMVIGCGFFDLSIAEESLLHHRLRDSPHHIMHDGRVWNTSLSDSRSKLRHYIIDKQRAKPV
ncbi:unnamed protein product [Rhodiola kirilowii]